MSVEGNKKIVTEFFRIFSSGDVSGALEMLTADSTWEIVGKPHLFPFAGKWPKEEFRKSLDTLPQHMPGGVTMTPKFMIGEGDWVAAEVESLAHHVSGKIYNNRYGYFIRIEGDKIASIQEHLDTSHAIEVLMT